MNLISCFGFVEEKINGVKKIRKSFYMLPRGASLFGVIIRASVLFPLAIFTFSLMCYETILHGWNIKIPIIYFYFIFGTFLLGFLNSISFEISKEYLIVKEYPFALKWFWIKIERAKIKKIYVKEKVVKNQRSSGTTTYYIVDCIYGVLNKNRELYSCQNFYESEGLAKTLIINLNLELEKPIDPNAYVID